MGSVFTRNIVVTTPREVLDSTGHFIQMIHADMLSQVPVSSEFSVGAAATFTAKGGDRVRPFPGGETSAVKGRSVLTAMPFKVRGNSLVESVRGLLGVLGHRAIL